MKAILMGATLAAALGFAASAQAQINPNDISLGEPGYGGNGCPSGTV